MPNPPPLSTESIEELFGKVQAGDTEALAAFFDSYAEPLRYVIRARMNQQLRSAWDSADFLQGTCKEALASKICEQQFASPAALLAFLKTIAERQVVLPHSSSGILEPGFV